MSDLIKELRELAASEEVADRAADELERLQRENEEYEVQQRAATAVMHDASAKIKNLEAELAALKAQSTEPVAEVVSSGEYELPLLRWLSADISLSTPIGALLYLHPPTANSRGY